MKTTAKRRGTTRAFRTVSPERMTYSSGEINITDYRVFWYTQYLMGVLWTLFSIVALFSLSLENLTVCLISLFLNMTNTVGYFRCDRNHQKKVSSYLLNKA